MAYTTDNTTQQALDRFRRFDADTQLALLWYGYLDIKNQLKPGAGPSVENPATALFDEIKALPREQQLQAQRDIAGCKPTPIGRAYSALASSAKLDLWLLLAQGMENGTIIGMPENYQLPSETKDFVNQIKQLDFEQRINFTRSAVDLMGANPNAAKVV